MCGIAGELNWQTTPGTDSVRRMCDTMIHRGPDDSGIVGLKHIVLGHRRLSIIDLSQKARQPMVSSDNRYYIVYNGELYNFRELKKELESKGIVFNTMSDTEVVLYAYVHWGARCLEKFNGMFAFAVWDNKNNELFLTRDRFGQKPLYYYIGAHKVVFASRLNALLCDDTIPRDISYEALNCYLALGYILSPMTLYKNVSKLEPATCMLISNNGGKITKTKYWDYAEKFADKTSDTENDIMNNIGILLEKSVQRRMISDVPVGAFLSGGLDSSSIAMLMKKNHTGDLHTFSIGFEQKSYNELPDADRAADWIGTIHHGKICTSDNGISFIDDALNSYDEPFSDTSLIPMIEVSRLASSYVKVVLSGDGADEMFAGYMTYKADKCYFLSKLMPVFLRKLIVAYTAQKSLREITKLNWAYRQKQFFYGSLHTPEKAHYLWRIVFHPEERVRILGEQYKELVYETDPYAIFKKYYDHVKGLKSLDRHLYVDGMTWLVDDILVKLDRASMHSSIEARCPYLDVDLVSYAAAIEPELKMKGFTGKYILKKALNSILPDFVINKRKSGFSAPTGDWIGHEGVDAYRTFNKYVFNNKVKQPTARL